MPTRAASTQRNFRFPHETDERLQSYAATHGLTLTDAAIALIDRATAPRPLKRLPIHRRPLVSFTRRVDVGPSIGVVGRYVTHISDELAAIEEENPTVARELAESIRDQFTAWLNSRKEQK